MGNGAVFVAFEGGWITGIGMGYNRETATT
jgi:hypothetical protein